MSPMTSAAGGIPLTCRVRITWNASPTTHKQSSARWDTRALCWWVIPWAARSPKDSRRDNPPVYLASLIEHPNRGKRSAGIDVSTPGGQEVLYELAKTSDVFLTNYLPAQRQQNRFDVEHIRAMNSKIVYARGSAYGDKGAERDALAKAKVAAKNFRNGALSPNALRCKPISEEVILASPVLATADEQRPGLACPHVSYPKSFPTSMPNYRP